MDMRPEQTEHDLAPPVANPDGSPEKDDGQSSGAPLDGLTAAFRILLIALLVAGGAAFGMWQGKQLPGMSVLTDVFRGSKPPADALLGDFPLLDTDVALSSEPVVLNGREVSSVRCTSPFSPKNLMSVYAQRLRDHGYELESPGRGADRTVRFVGEGQAMMGLRDPEGGFLGIVAFSNTIRGGCDYYVIREGVSSADERPGGGDVSGADPPGVPAPPGSTREYSVQRKGRHPSFLNLYRADASPNMVAELMRARMEEQGWTEPGQTRDAMAMMGDGRHLMFRRGDEQVLVAVTDPPDGTRGSWVTLIYKKRVQ